MTLAHLLIKLKQRQESHARQSVNIGLVSRIY
nr:MAG TPA: hypothetical protein [Caudoviricetes sp.]